MKFFIDGRFDVRALSKEDKGHQPVPYDTTILTVTQSSIANTEVLVQSLNNTHWGVNNAWVTYSYIIFLWSMVDFMTEARQGWRFELFNLGESDDWGVRQHYQEDKHKPMLDNTLYQILITEYIPNGFYTSNSQSLRTVINNMTGQTINATVWFAGLVI